MQQELQSNHPLENLNIFENFSIEKNTTKMILLSYIDLDFALKIRCFFEPTKNTAAKYWRLVKSGK